LAWTEVESAGAELQVAGLDVHDHVVAHRPPGRPAPRPPGVATLAGHFTTRRCIGLGRSPASTTFPGAASASRRGVEQRQGHVEHASSATTLTPSSGWWLRSGPVGQVHAVELGGLDALASDPPPVTIRCGSYPHARSAPSAASAHDDGRTR